MPTEQTQAKSNFMLMFTLRSRGDIDESDNFTNFRSCQLALDSIAIHGLDVHTLLSVLLLAAGVPQVSCLYGVCMYV